MLLVLLQVKLLMQLLKIYLHSSVEVPILAGSNKTTMKNAGDFSAEDYAGKNIWFGVREFAMGAALNGMALHGGLNVFGGTFFVFSDYVRPAIRLSALNGTSCNICIHT